MRPEVRLNLSVYPRLLVNLMTQRLKQPKTIKGHMFGYNEHISVHHNYRRPHCFPAYIPVEQKNTLSRE